ncbi:MAG: helix-hairpin-helix domain-containing protein [Nitrospiraceae bacterium]|nr:helix-hairpin-helix domain-containing protein [Nitrospiraceae bacterium]
MFSKKTRALKFLFIFSLVAVVVFCLSTQGAFAAAVDINSASQKELEGLKGIGAAKAKKIIANRPYSSVDELSKAGLSKKDIDTIRPNVTAGTAATKAETKPAADKKTAKTEKSKTQKLAPGEKVNINTASKEKIEALPEIGPKKAQAIIDARPFKTKEDIMKVKGIKQKTYDKIKDSITVD